MTYAEDDDLRRELRIKARSRAYPENLALLQNLIKKRHQLANLLGFESFAQLSMQNQMIENPENAQYFLDSISNALEKPVQLELSRMLERLKKDRSGAQTVEVWQTAYLQKQRITTENIMII